MQVELLDELGEETRLCVQGQVGVGPHRGAVAPEGEYRGDAPMICVQPFDHLVPQGIVHHQAVDEDQRRTVATRVEILDLAGAQLDGLHLVLSLVVPHSKARWTRLINLAG